MSTAIILKQRPGQPGNGGGLTPNRFKKLEFDSAPAVMEFGLSIGSGTDPLVLTGGMEADALKAALESCTDLSGFTVDVYGGTQVSGTGPDGVALHTGTFLVVLHGTAPFPAWGVVQNAEVQSLVIGEVDSGDVAYLATGAGTSTVNGVFTPDGTHDGVPAFRRESSAYLYRHSVSHTWVIGAAPEEFDESGDLTLYTSGTSGDRPPLTGWSVSTGSGPAPTLAYNDLAYTLNGGSPFSLGNSLAEIQTNQRALGSGYTDVMVKGKVIYRNLLKGSSISHNSGVYAGAVENMIDGNENYGIWFSGSVDIIFDRGPAAPPATVARIYKYLAASTDSITTSADNETYGAELAIDDTLLRYVKLSLTRGEGPVVQEISIEATPEEEGATLHSYFPFTTGNIANPAATGTGAAVSTLHQGGSESQLVTASEAGAEGVLLLGLQSPFAAPTAGEFTPNPAHWYAPLPATQEEALNRIAAMIYNWWLYSIPNLP